MAKCHIIAGWPPQILFNPTTQANRQQTKGSQSSSNLEPLAYNDKGHAYILMTICRF